MRPALLPISLLLFSCAPEDDAPDTPAPAYETLHHPQWAGAFFQLEYQGDRYVACSRHQAQLKRGTRLQREGSQDAVVLVRRVHAQKDLQLWTFEGPTADPDHFLFYRQDPAVEVGERIYLLNRGKAIPARVEALPEGDRFRVIYRSDQPFAAAGLSGSPVYLPRTGAVVGVLQTANDPKKATLGGFELIELE